MVWTRFMDMHSGGGKKEKWEYIYIEAAEEQAKIIFFNRFGHNPERVTCTCCGRDYSIEEDETLQQISAFERGCRYAYFNSEGKEIPEVLAWKSGIGFINGAFGKYVEEPETELRSRKFVSFSDYLKDENVKFIFNKEIKPSERKGKLPKQGYVWVGE